MIQLSLAKKYAVALINTTEKKERVDVLEQAINLMDHIYDNECVFKGLTNPSISSDQKKALLDAILEKTKASQSIRNFFSLLHRKKRLEILPHLKMIMVELFHECGNTLPATIELAAEVSEESKSKILSLLQSHSTRKILPTFEINSDLMGGFRVTMDGKVFDGSLENTLKQLKESIASV